MAAPFAKFTLSTDMLIACKGAHQHHDGAVIILGTAFVQVPAAKPI